MLTETELNLMKILILKGLDHEEVVAAMSIILTKHMEDKLLIYLKDQNPGASRNEIMKIISGRMMI